MLRHRNRAAHHSSRSIPSHPLALGRFHPRRQQLRDRDGGTIRECASLPPILWGLTIGWPIELAGSGPYNQGWVGRPGSRCAFGRGGKSGLHRAACRLTAGSHLREEGATESATEKIPPRPAGVRVKWCGKGAPRLGQPERQGKPHAEQDQIGGDAAARRAGAPGRSLEASGNRRSR